MEARTAGIIVQNRDVFLAEAWHEGDTGDHCLESNGSTVTLHAKSGHQTLGPYRRIAVLNQSESWAYFSLFAKGCYAASDGTRWCISEGGVTVDSKPLAARFSLDSMEQPDYGTSLLVDGGAAPLLVFVPVPTGFHIFRDTWVTDDKRVPVQPDRDKPLIVLTRLS